MKQTLLFAVSALASTSTVLAQAPEILHYTFDGGIVQNTAAPGTGSAETVTDVGFAASTACGGTSGESLSTSCLIETNWALDLGTSDWTVGMRVDLETAGNGFQYFFGSPSASGFRCFCAGAAGVDDIMLRSPGGDIIVPGATLPGGPRHIVFVYDSTALEIRGYVDGVLTATQAQSSALDLMATAPDFTVMGYTSSMTAGNLMDEFRFYRRALSDIEVMDWAACGGTTIGTSYCAASVNSTGLAGVMSVLGSESVSANSVTLMGSEIPRNSFSLFLTSRQTGLVANPGGSQGSLCLGGGIGRYVGAGQIQQAGIEGVVSLDIDLNLTPDPQLGLIAVLPGETWHYQAWYRDGIGGLPTSNFTDAVTVVYQ